MLASNAGDSIELIQTSGKFMLEISPKSWSVQPYECELVGMLIMEVIRGQKRYQISFISTER